MEGSKQDPGINYRAMKELFRSVCTSVNNPFTCGIHLVVNGLQVYGWEDNTDGQISVSCNSMEAGSVFL